MKTASLIITAVCVVVLMLLGVSLAEQNEQTTPQNK